VVSPGGPGMEGGTVDWELDRGSSWHHEAVVRIQDGIAAGDYYQVNLTSHFLSLRSSTPSTVPPASSFVAAYDTFTPPLGSERPTPDA